MIRKIFYGDTNSVTATAVDLSWNEKLALTIIVALILWMGIYPQTMLHVTEQTSTEVINKLNNIFSQKQ